MRFVKKADVHWNTTIIIIIILFVIVMVVPWSSKELITKTKKAYSFFDIINDTKTSEEQLSLFKKGDEYFILNNYERAVYYYENAIRVNPKSNMAAKWDYKLAKSYYGLSRYDDAKVIYETLLENGLSKEERETVYWDIFNIYLEHEKDYEKASELFVKYDSKYPKTKLGEDMQAKLAK